MAKIPTLFPFAQDVKKPEAMYQWFRRTIASVGNVVNGQLGFGDGSDVDNIAGKWINYTTNAVANTEDVVAHNFGSIPYGYLVFSQDKAASLYKGATAWNSTNIYLKCSVASVTVRIFILTSSTSLS